jgi:integrase
MTTASNPSPAAGIVPAPDSPVLFDRPLNPNSVQPMSLFADDWWDVGPGLFETHASSKRMNFATVPARFRPAAKHYIWQLINHDIPRHRSTAEGRRLALRSIVLDFARVTAFLQWLDARDIARIADVTPELLEQYATDVAALEATTNLRTALLIEVRRLWSYRDLLPDDDRLPQAPPWSGARPSELIGGAKRNRENRTRRIASQTMEPLLMWCLRIIEDFAGDIIAAYQEYLRLWGQSPAARNASGGYTGARTSPRQAGPAVDAWLQNLQRNGGTLPTRARPDGRQVDWRHLCRMFDVNEYAFRPGGPLRMKVEAAGLPLGWPPTLDTPITATLHGRPWRTTSIAYDEAASLARRLSTAAMVVIAYLSGMRPGEVLNLERGCVRYDPVTHLWSIVGKHWKNARDSDGNQIAQGVQRADPWTTIAAVAAAVSVLERLHRHQLLFTAHLHPTRLQQPTPVRPGQRRITRFGLGRTTGEFTNDIAALTAWINSYAGQQNLVGERIPADPHGAVTPARFRRTLAWHIVRRPRGLIAGAIQYGHLHVQMTLGYAGTYDSGFPDEHAYEDWLFRLETLAENHRRLAAGEHVSGPAADTYRHRITAAQHQFAGRVLTSPKHVHDLVTNPLLQIYPGRALTCVFDPAKALCQLHPAEDDARRTPDHDDCRPQCQNIAVTDRDIADVRRRAADLRTIVGDRLAPSLRHHRDRAELDRLRAIIRRHDHGK